MYCYVLLCILYLAAIVLSHMFDIASEWATPCYLSSTLRDCTSTCIISGLHAILQVSVVVCYIYSSLCIHL